MPPTVRRSVLNVKVVVETTGGVEEHRNSVAWVANQLKESTRFMRNGFVATQVIDSATGARLGFSGHGSSPSDESREILDDLFDVDPT
jgi:hypothetical protein